MKANVGKFDRIFRFALAAVLAILAYSEIIPNEFQLVAYIIAIVFALTGLIRVCPLYMPFGISTRREK
ncbi:DUF2892 domain-containing protein [Sandaracinomonas limnophila]|uniref:DUF2892 domain-containing protein n=1 Tax=Sandaracinomonas limnophila TaxID=1862386 RepID=A0A437PWE7_9BACT|nr:DUF2892 domain-containing protein [Sandaracinomonas limnophila]RVU26576.1 DUF2892 domain-containing protein [Sandaracinomonas limnophila]